MEYCQRIPLNPFIYPFGGIREWQLLWPSELELPWVHVVHGDPLALPHWPQRWPLRNTRWLGRKRSRAWWTGYNEPARVCFLLRCAACTAFGPNRGELEKQSLPTGRFQGLPPPGGRHGHQRPPDNVTGSPPPWPGYSLPLSWDVKIRAWVSWLGERVNKVMLGRARRVVGPSLNRTHRSLI